MRDDKKREAINDRLSLPDLTNDEWKGSSLLSLVICHFVFYFA